MSDEVDTVKDALGPKCEAILKACGNLAAFQHLVANHCLTGNDIVKGTRLINVNEQILEAGGARV